MAGSAVKAKIRNKFNVDEELESPFDIGQLRRASHYVFRYKWRMLEAFLLSIASILIDLVTPLFTTWVIDDMVPDKIGIVKLLGLDVDMNGVIESLTGFMSGAIPARNIRGILLLGVFYLITFVIILTINRWRSLIFNTIGQAIITDMRHDLFVHLQKLPFDYFDSRPHGKILTRVVNYINAVGSFLSNGIISILIELLALIFIFFFMLRLHVGLTIMVLTGLPLFILAMYFIKTPQRRAYQILSNKQSNLNAYLHESINGIKVTQAFDREETNYGIYTDLCNASRKSWLHAVSISNVIWPIIMTLSVVYTVLIYYTVTAGWFAGVTVGVMLAFVNYTGRFWGPIQTLGNLYNQVITNTAYLERIFQLLDEPVSIDDRPGARELPPITGRVEFNDVVFGYEPTQTILDHVSFVAEPGESIALVGPTGAGKSTIVSLLARFYDIRSGQITIDGHPLWDVTLSSLRSQMGMMLQDSFLFTGTIKENIRYGRLDATDEEIVAAAKAVHADDFISKMPDGYDTEVQERGASLSAGQRQLISFARTMLSDPRILILDEATSSIDTQTEQLVQEGLNALMKGRTSFIIAHRLSTIKNCRILYIQDGKIAESGTHRELLDRQGLYYELYTSQLT